MPSRADKQDRFGTLRAGLEGAAKGLDLFDAAEEMKGVDPVPVRKLRRRGPEREPDNIEMMTLVEADGVLRWEQGFGFRGVGRRRRARRGPVRRGEVVKQFKFEKLEQNKVGETLAKLDKKFNDVSGMRSWTENGYKTLQRAPQTGRHLLVIHGTFSKSKAVMDNIRETKPGKNFLRKALGHYDSVLVFDHPTVSVSPILNALDLDRAFAGSNATVDVICHSRGGLVTRWWLEVLNDMKGRCDNAILVGSPLAGTSLASPPALRSALDLFTNVANLLGKAASLVPLLQVVTGVMRLVSAATKIVAKTPIIDAAVSMIPGLVAQSRTSDNPELQRLRRGAASAPLPNYYAVRSDFEPESPGWEFWKHFTDSPKLRVIDKFADPVFDGPNDLVVDTASMTDLGDSTNIKKLEDFGKNGRVHHLNYFQQPETIKFFHDTLKVPK